MFSQYGKPPVCWKLGTLKQTEPARAHNIEEVVAIQRTEAMVGGTWTHTREGPCGKCTWTWTKTKKSLAWRGNVLHSREHWLGRKKTVHCSRVWEKTGLIKGDQIMEGELPCHCGDQWLSYFSVVRKDLRNSSANHLDYGWKVQTGNRDTNHKDRLLPGDLLSGILH